MLLHRIATGSAVIYHREYMNAAVKSRYWHMSALCSAFAFSRPCCDGQRNRTLQCMQERYESARGIRLMSLFLPTCERMDSIFSTSFATRLRDSWIWSFMGVILLTIHFLSFNENNTTVESWFPYNRVNAACRSRLFLEGRPYRLSLINELPFGPRCTKSGAE